MPRYVFRGEQPRTYPEPPLARQLRPGEVIELEPAEVPSDGRFESTSQSGTPAKPRKEAL